MRNSHFLRNLFGLRTVTALATSNPALNRLYRLNPITPFLVTVAPAAPQGTSPKMQPPRSKRTNAIWYRGAGAIERVEGTEEDAAPHEKGLDLFLTLISKTSF